MVEILVFGREVSGDALANHSQSPVNPTKIPGLVFLDGLPNKWPLRY